MRRFTTPIALIAAVAVAVAAKLWLDLRSERQLTTALRAELSEARLAGFASPRPATERTAGEAVAVAATASQAQPQALPMASPQPVQRNGVRNPLERQLIADPEYRRGRETQMRLTLRRQNAGLREELGLSGSEEEALFALLASNELATAEQLAGVSRAGSYDPGAAAEEARIRQEGQRQLEDQLLAMLGGERYGQLKAYLESRTARGLSSIMVAQLEQYGVPVSREQIRPLTAAIVAEQQRQAEPERAFAQLFRNADAASQARLREESQRRAMESSRRMLEVAAPYLNEEQLAVLRAELDAQDAMTRAARRIQNAHQEETSPKSVP